MWQPSSDAGEALTREEVAPDHLDPRGPFDLLGPARQRAHGPSLAGEAAQQAAADVARGSGDEFHDDSNPDRCAVRPIRPPRKPARSGPLRQDPANSEQRKSVGIAGSRLVYLAGLLQHVPSCRSPSPPAARTATSARTCSARSTWTSPAPPSGRPSAAWFPSVSSPSSFAPSAPRPPTPFPRRGASRRG